MKNFLLNILPFNNREDMPAWQFAIKKFLAFWLCFIAGSLIAEGVVIGLHFAMGKNPLEGEMLSPELLMIFTYYGYIIFIAIALLYWKLIEKKPIKEIGVSGNFASYFIGAAAGAVLIVICAMLITLTGGFTFNGVFDNADYPLILVFFGGFIIQGGMEELLCRGLVQQSLSKKLPLPAAIGISALVFIMPHVPSFDSGILSVLSLVDLILVSLIFSLLTLYFDSIWAACGLHSFWNFILFNILGLNLSGNDEKVTAVFNITSNGRSVLNGGDYGIEASVITAAVLAVCAALLFVLYRKKKN